MKATQKYIGLVQQLTIHKMNNAILINKCVRGRERLMLIEGKKKTVSGE